MSTHKKKRTHTPSRLAKWMALLPTSCVLLYPFYLAGQLYTDTQQYCSPALPASFDGLKITFVSDIHFGSLFGKERVEHLVQQVNSLKSDIILLGGDYGETSQGALDFFALNPRFEAPLGVFATVGNHDRTLPENNLKKIKQAMAVNGITPLVNDAWVIRRNGASLAVCSVDDFYNGHPDLEHITHLVSDADFVIFMPHTPDILPECEKMRASFFHLALCGHTHGGQVALFNRPILSSSMYGKRYNSGWYKENGADIFVSTGVGTSAFPVRFGSKPQIHQFTFKHLDP